MKKTLDILFAAAVALVLLAAGVLTLRFGARRTTSYYENRTLAARPTLTAQSAWDGSYAAEAETWLSDHFPGREPLLKLDTWVQMKLLRRVVVNDTVVTGDVLLPLLTFGEYSAEAYRESVAPFAEGYGKLNEWVRSHGGKLLFVGFPEQRVYFEDAFPAYLNSHKAEAKAADDTFFEALAAQGVDCLDMREVYDALGHGAAFYSAVDHHFHYRGAYAAYRAIMEKLAEDGRALPVLTEEKIEFKELPNPYIGSRNRKLHNLWEHAEKAEIIEQREPIGFERFDDGAPSDKPLYVLPAEDGLPTTYNLYMGGDFGETVLKTHREDLPNALIFGDSFTNALETLLYTAFNETRILDLQHYTEKSLKDYIAEYRPEIVIAVGNDTFYYTPSGNGAVWED